MSYERERRLFAILDDALDAAPADRPALLDRLCGDDAALCAEVEALLANEPSGLLEEPAFNIHGDDPAEAAALGQRIGDYELVELLGRGGMGTVYLAQRATFEQRVAVKIIRRGLDLDPVLIQRFENERAMLARLEHPGIARLLDGGATTDGLPYVVMEYIDGEPLDVYCRRRRLGLRARIELFLKVLDAVRYAHQNLIVHRDLKPGNILVDAAGQPKLLDFGIAKWLVDDSAASTLRTATGESPMTPRYASPEQIRRQPISTGADVYVLGVLLFELLTGVPAYGTDDPAELPRWVCEREVERPSTAVRRRDGGLPGVAPERLRRRLAGDLDAIVTMAMRKSPADRYGSAEALAGDLLRHLEGLPVRARRGDFRYRAGKFIRRNRVGLAVLALFVMTVSAAAGTVMFYALEAEKNAEALQAQAEREIRLVEFLTDITATPGKGETARDVTARVLAAEEALLEEGALDASEMEGRAQIAGRLGRLWRRSGDFEQARLALAAAHRWAKVAHGPGGWETVKHINNDTAVLVDLELYDEAVDRFREQVRAFEEVGTAEKKTFKARSNLATVLKHRGDLEEAGRIHGHVLDRREALYLDVYGPDDEDVATSRHNVAAVHYAAGRFLEALPLAEQALGSRGRVLGEDALETSATRDLVGQIQIALGRDADAVPTLEAALEARIRKTDVFDHRVAQTQRHLAEALAASDPARAENLLRDAIETLRRQPGTWRLAEAQNLQAFLRPEAPGAEEAARLGAETVAAVRGDGSTPALRAKARWLAVKNLQKP